MDEGCVCGRRVLTREGEDKMVEIKKNKNCNCNCAIVVAACSMITEG